MSSILSRPSLGNLYKGPLAMKNALCPDEDTTKNRIFCLVVATNIEVQNEMEGFNN